MSFASIAQQAFGQRPFYLYLFKRGTVENLFTSGKSDITRVVAGVAGTVWVKSSIYHDGIPDSAESFRSEFPITFPLTDSFARQFLEGLSFQETRVTIWKGFVNDPDNELIVQYKGLIVGNSPNQDRTIKLNCMTSIAYLQRKALSQVVQRPCRHVLYGTKCGVDRTDFEVTGNIDTVQDSGSTILLSEADAAPDGYYNGGIIEHNGRLEMIISHIGNVLSLAARLDPVSAGQAVKIYPGCNLTRSTCTTRFSNDINFGGFEFIQDTPFDGRSIV